MHCPSASSYFFFFCYRASVKLRMISTEMMIMVMSAVLKVTVVGGPGGGRGGR